VSERDDTKAIDDLRDQHEFGQVRKPWETPVLEELAVQLSAHRPGRGVDGDFFRDCTRT
jgi:hypothetical protein